MEETALINAIVQGDKKAFDTLYRSFREKVFRTAFHYLQHTQEAEEAVQDVFVEVYRSAPAFHFKSSLSTWIYRITVNKCLDRLRYRQAKKRFAFITHFFQHDHPGAPAVAPVEANEDNKMLYAAIDKLPGNQKTALILTQIEELSIKETAAIMKTTAKAVESLTQRAKNNLRKFLIKK